MKIQQKNLKSFFTKFTDGSNLRIEETCLYIEKKYHDKATFYDCLAFINHLSSLFSAKSKFGLIAIMISSMDSKMELLNALNLASIGIYKSSFDSLRRALEITLVGLYFDLVKGDEIEFEDKELKNEILGWYESKVNTPFFKKIKSNLPKKGNFKVVCDKLAWITQIQELYNELSDIAHTKGLENSIMEINKTKKFYNTPEFNEETLKLVLNYFIRTTVMIATSYAIHNPILTYGLPVFEKFGPSMKGLYEEHQANILLKIIPENIKQIIMEIVKKDNDIQEKIRKIEEMPVSEDYMRFKTFINTVKL